MNDFSFSQFKIIFQQFKSWINENYVNDKQEVVKMQLTQTNHKTWKTQTFVDQLGLIVPQGKEGYFTDKECATLFQDLLKIKQRNGLLTHYLLRQKDDSSMETISYNAYVKFRCPDGSPDHTRVVDLFHIRYKIIRLEQNKSNLPLLFLFKPYCGTRQCQFCKDKHQFKIYQSSFYAIRSKFLLLLQQKISFMLRYKTYYFIPHSHIQPNDCGNAPYQHVKDINNNKITLYFEKSETVIVNALRAQALRRGIDCQFIRGSQFQKSELDFIMRDKQKDMQKLKYMCGLRGKNKPNHVWTTFDFLLLTTSYYHLRKPLKAQQEETFDTSSSKQYIQMLIPSEKEYSIQDILPKDTKNQNKQFQNRRLNRSIQSQVEKYQLIESEISKIARWHQQISKYKHPFILTIDIQIPKMQCATCKVMKEGLAFLTNLIDYINSFLMIEVLSKVEELSKEIQNKK